MEVLIEKRREGGRWRQLSGAVVALPEAIKITHGSWRLILQLWRIPLDNWSLTLELWSLSPD
jgi:hypothetical protein